MRSRDKQLRFKTLLCSMPCGDERIPPQMLADLQRRVNEVADGARSTMPICAKCQQSRVCQDVRPVSCALFLDNCVWACRVTVAPYADPNPGLCWIYWASNRGGAWRGCWHCWQRWPRIRWQPVAGCDDQSHQCVCGVAQRLGQAAANYSESLSRYHGDSRSDQARLNGNSETASVMNSEHT